MSMCLKDHCPDIDSIASQGEEYARAHLNPELFTLYSRLMRLFEQMESPEDDWRQLVPPSFYKWRMNVTAFYKFFIGHRETIIGSLSASRIYITDNGKVSCDPVTHYPFAFLSLPGPVFESFRHLEREGMGVDEVWNRLSQFADTCYLAAMFAISFMHCKNVILTDVVPERRVVRNKSAKRRDDQAYQPVPYKVIDIFPMRKVLKKVEDGLEGNTDRTTRAFHICRGHFADYSEGRGLFGKHHGTFWIPQHTRGNAPGNMSGYRINL